MEVRHTIKINIETGSGIVYDMDPNQALQYLLNAIGTVQTLRHIDSVCKTALERREELYRMERARLDDEIQAMTRVKRYTVSGRLIEDDDDKAPGIIVEVDA